MTPKIQYSYRQFFCVNRVSSAPATAKIRHWSFVMLYAQGWIELKTLVKLKHIDVVSKVSIYVIVSTGTGAIF